MQPIEDRAVRQPTGGDEFVDRGTGLVLLAQGLGRHRPARIARDWELWVHAADFWGTEFSWLTGHFPECFLLPGGSDSRRVLAVTEPDEEGEYPVFALDLDDMPYLGLMYPGFDVYLADTAGLLDLGKRQTYTDLIDDATYGPRMRGHAARCFVGEACVQYLFECEPLFAQLYPEKARRGNSAR
ncbi:hypothetical protein ALMP_84480 [Streptomyces sp. A012304]|nr:hypothetical protein [Streptomyces sp. A012304]GKQ41936.1 hypothetical protein ALMP_84480 [Streptomyces sp. A012304]